MRTLLLVLCAGMVASFGFAQPQDEALRYATSITKEDLSKHLHIIASDEYEGRETGKKGQKMAADYLRKEFEKYGLKNPSTKQEEAYFQTFSILEKKWEKFTLQTPKKTFELNKEFAIFEGTPTQKEYEFVFAGYGIEDKAYSDYEKIEVKGKIVVLFAGEPKDNKGNFFVSGDSQKASAFATSRMKKKIAKEKGAAGIVLVYNTQEEYESILKNYWDYINEPTLTLENDAESDSFLFLISAPAYAAQLLDTKENQLRKLLTKSAKTKTSAAGKFKTTVQCAITRNVSKISTENVLGYIEGTDKKDEFIVISAHYDHEGKKGEEIFNGADDDGSGTVAILEIAQAFAQAKTEGKSPRRSILFMGFTAEEKGLLGSEYYAQNPVFPLSKTVLNLNIDMIGRMDEAHEGNPNYVYLIGTDMLSSELHQISEQIAKKYSSDIALDYTYNTKDDPNQYYYRSDHYNFAKHGIPVIFYFNGTHQDYHKATDEVDKIHFGKIEKISRLIFHTAWEVANREDAPRVDKTDSK